MTFGRKSQGLSSSQQTLGTRLVLLTVYAEWKWLILFANFNKLFLIAAFFSFKVLGADECLYAVGQVC